MTRLALAFVVCAAVTPVMNAADAPAPGVKDQIAELDPCAQLIVVLTESWKPGPARLRTFERQRGMWTEVGDSIPASVGRNGVAWGVGLHGSYPPGGPVKKEGDGKSPAGVFALGEAFGSLRAEEAGITHYPYRQMTSSFAGVDDPSSRHYNRIVDSSAVAKDWSSAENMIPANGTYRLACVVKHNWRPFPGYGSCIFLHIWKGEMVPTSGCAAMAQTHLERVLRWLDRSKAPLLVQLPASEYEARRSGWQLPEVR